MSAPLPLPTAPDDMGAVYAAIGEAVATARLMMTAELLQETRPVGREGA